MSLSTAVTEKGVTFTASATAEEIRESAGFAEPAKVVEAEPEEVPAKVDDAPSPDRNPDGTFKSKPKDDAGDPRKSYQAKINAAIAKQRDAERRAAEAEAKVAALSAPKPVETTPEPPPARVVPHRDLVKRYQQAPDWPQIEDFFSDDFADPHAALTAAQSAYILDKQLAEREARAEQEATERDLVARVQSVHQRSSEAHADWNDLLSSEAAKTPLPEPVLAEIYDDEDSSADVIHYLMTHPDEIQALTLVTHPIAAARAITKIRLGLTSASSGPEPTPTPAVTKAKPMIKPVKGSPAAPEASSSVDLPLSKYIQLENARERREREASRGA